MLLRIIRFIKGYVDFTAEGRFPERFLNAAAVDKLNLWNASPCERGISATTSAGEYKSIRSTARKAGVRLKIKRKRGVPFIAKKHSDRIGLPIGALLGAVLLIFLSQFIWTVEVVGAQNVSDYRILQSLKNHGVYPGGFKGGFDVRSAQRAVQFDIDELSWVSINTLGCKSTVDVREKAEKSDPPADPAPCNIKAKRDGVVTKINAENGFTEVEIGSGVAKGDLLVSGVMPTRQNTIRFVRAEAEVYADITDTVELTIPKNYDYNSISENKVDRNELNFLWLNLPASLSFTSYPNSVCTQSSEKIELNGNPLPLGLTVQTSREVQSSNAALSREQAKAAFEKSLMLSECFEMEDCKIKSRDIKITEQNGAYKCECGYIFSQNIAESVEFNVTEG